MNTNRTVQTQIVRAACSQRYHLTKRYLRIKSKSTNSLSDLVDLIQDAYSSEHAAFKNIDLTAAALDLAAVWDADNKSALIEYARTLLLNK